MMTKNDLKSRSEEFAINVINLSEALLHNPLISKMETVIEESDETLFWLPIVQDSSAKTVKAHLNQKS